MDGDADDTGLLCKALVVADFLLHKVTLSFAQSYTKFLIWIMLREIHRGVSIILEHRLKKLK